MTIVPGKVAGCDEVVACLPPNAHTAMIAGCHLSGADRIFRIGGAQAIAAMAFGTETVPRVNKIMGPGNAFVNEAKRQVFGPVGIDQLAGPSEIFVVADHTGNPVLIATDLLAQAEHDVRTRVGLITTDRALAEATLKQVAIQLEVLETAKIAAESWQNYGEIVLCADEATMIAYSDDVAAEHLQVHTADPMAFSKKLRNYGSLFIGENASVVYSDKTVGTNHTLPTMGAGRYTGGLWVGSYVKIATYQWLEQHAVEKVAPPRHPPKRQRRPRRPPPRRCGSAGLTLRLGQGSAPGPRWRVPLQTCNFKGKTKRGDITDGSNHPSVMSPLFVLPSKSRGSGGSPPAGVKGAEPPGLASDRRRCERRQRRGFRAADHESLHRD